jgi:lipoyl(octanoyl) transferase
MTDPRRNHRWRILVVPPRNGAENMARDVGLMRRARETGESVFSIYGWTRPTLSFGRNQTAVGRYNLERISALGIDTVRRPTGGRALLHHREVTYSVTAPAVTGVALRESYERINVILLAALAHLGVAALVAEPDAAAPRPHDSPCFAAPSRGELISNGRKLVGSAQWRQAGALLQHGSILIEDDQSLIPLVTVAQDAGNMTPPGTLTRALGRTPAVDEVAHALADAVRETEDPDARAIDESEIRDYTRAEVPRFANEVWTWRR